MPSNLRCVIPMTLTEALLHTMPEIISLTTSGTHSSLVRHNLEKPRNAKLAETGVVVLSYCPWNFPHPSAEMRSLLSTLMLCHVGPVTCAEGPDSTVGWLAEPEKDQPSQPLALCPPSDGEAALIGVSVGSVCSDATQPAKSPGKYCYWRCLLYFLFHQPSMSRIYFWSFFFNLLKDAFLLIFLQRVKGRKKHGSFVSHTHPTRDLTHNLCALTENLICNLLVYRSTSIN